jgi:hypothetical protein
MQNDPDAAGDRMRSEYGSDYIEDGFRALKFAQTKSFRFSDWRFRTALPVPPRPNGQDIGMTLALSGRSADDCCRGTEPGSGCAH